MKKWCQAWMRVRVKRKRNKLSKMTQSLASKAFFGMVGLFMMPGLAVLLIRYNSTWCSKKEKEGKKKKNPSHVCILNYRLHKFCWHFHTHSLNWECYQASYCKFSMGLWEAGLHILLVFCMWSIEAEKRKRMSVSRTMSYRLAFQEQTPKIKIKIKNHFFSFLLFHIIPKPFYI